jgi:diaminopimelate decarboxylase
VVADAGINLVPSAQGLQHEIRNLSRASGPAVHVDVRGPLCMQVDLLGRDVEMAEPEVGDILAVYETGAYDFGHSFQFIRLRPAVVMIEAAGLARLIRRAETTADLLAFETD